MASSEGVLEEIPRGAQQINDQLDTTSSQSTPSVNPLALLDGDTQNCRGRWGRGCGKPFEGMKNPVQLEHPCSGDADLVCLTSDMSIGAIKHDICCDAQVAKGEDGFMCWGGLEKRREGDVCKREWDQAFGEWGANERFSHTWRYQVGMNATGDAQEWWLGLAPDGIKVNQSDPQADRKFCHGDNVVSVNDEWFCGALIVGQWEIGLEEQTFDFALDGTFGVDAPDEPFPKIGRYVRPDEGHIEIQMFNQDGDLLNRQIMQISISGDTLTIGSEGRENVMRLTRTDGPAMATFEPAPRTPSQQILEGYKLLSPKARDAIVASSQKLGRYPTNNTEAGLEAATKIDAIFVDSIKVLPAKGVLEIAFGRQAGKAISGRSIYWVPEMSGGSIGWSCFSDSAIRSYVPSYCERTWPETNSAREQIEVGVKLAGGPKAAITEFFQDRGRFPKDNKESGLAEAGAINGFIIVDSVRVVPPDGMIEITFSRQADDVIAGHSIYMVPDASNRRSILWNCYSDSEISSYAPRYCAKQRPTNDVRQRQRR